MIHEQKVLGIITARGGSKGVIGKNVRLVGGKPLIAWTVEAGKASKYLDCLVLSSDDDVIIEVAKAYGCEVPFKRDPMLARDDTPSIDVVLDTLDRCPGYEWIVLLQPTSPLRKAEDIDLALEKCLALNAPACVSVCEVEESPYWMYNLRDSKLEPIVNRPLVERRQDLPKTYKLNGAVYVAKSSWLVQQKTFLMPSTVAYEMQIANSLDIDTETDIQLFQSILQQIGN